MNKIMIVSLVSVLGLAVAPAGASAHGFGGAGGGAGGFHGGGGVGGPRPMAAARVTPTAGLADRPALSTRLQALLPAGTTPQQACAGFARLGSCVAAIHVADHLGVPFTELKAQVTGSGAVSLGGAIHALRPDADAAAVRRTAEDEARQDLAATEP